jgi:hypothetical protein
VILGHAINNIGGFHKCILKGVISGTEHAISGIGGCHKSYWDML